MTVSVIYDTGSDIYIGCRLLDGGRGDEHNWVILSVHREGISNSTRFYCTHCLKVIEIEGYPR